MPKRKSSLRSEREFREAYSILNKWDSFKFKLPRGKNKFTPSQKSAISRKVKKISVPFFSQRDIQRRNGTDFVAYDYVKTRGKSLKVAAKIWGNFLVDGKKGFLIPRGRGVTRGKFTVRVWLDSAGNLRRKVRGSKEVYIYINEEKLITDEISYLLKIISPYIYPSNERKALFPNYPWSTEIKKKNDDFLRWGLLLYGHLGKEMKSLEVLISDFERYILDAMQREENPLRLQGLIGIRP